MDGANKLKFAIEANNGIERIKMINAMISDFHKKAVA
jgi:transcription-repair coupling factor (superfamily II helicase)